MMAMMMAVAAPAAPAFGASQRRGTNSQNSTSTGNAASSVDQSPDHNTEPWRGSSRCVYAQIMKADCRGAWTGCKGPNRRASMRHRHRHRHGNPILVLEHFLGRPQGGIIEVVERAHRDHARV